MSTACMIACSANQSSRIEVSLAMAVGVPIEVLRSGSAARSASIATSEGGVNPPVMSTHGKSSVIASLSELVRADVSRLSR